MKFVASPGNNSVLTESTDPFAYEGIGKFVQLHFHRCALQIEMGLAANVKKNTGSEARLLSDQRVIEFRWLAALDHTKVSDMLKKLKQENPGIEIVLSDTTYHLL